MGLVGQLDRIVWCGIEIGIIDEIVVESGGLVFERQPVEGLRRDTWSFKGILTGTL